MTEAEEAKFNEVFGKLMPIVTRMLLAMFGIYREPKEMDVAISNYLSAGASTEDRLKMQAAFRELRDGVDLAKEFARISYNRFRRKLRRDDKELGGTGISMDQPSPNLGPDEEAMLAETKGQYEAALQRIIAGLEEIDPLFVSIVRAYLQRDGNVTQMELAQHCSTNQTKVSRALSYFQYEVQQELNKLKSEEVT